MSVPLKRLDQQLFNQVAATALAAPRLRQNHNFHSLPDVVQRFINVLQPGTYVRPHRHLRSQGDGFEFFLVLQGKVGLILLDQEGQVLQIEQIGAQGPTYGIELAAGQFHTLIALTADTVLFELKEGPYVPADDKDFLTTFPLEGTPEAIAQVAQWTQLFA